MWKDRYTLSRMAREVSRATGWSEYLSLCHVVSYLHGKKGIGFSRKQLRYAFQKLPGEEIEGEEKEAWEWLLHLGGYQYQRGKKSPKGRSENTPYLSPYDSKINEIESLKVKPYQNTMVGEKTP